MIRIGIVGAENSHSRAIAKLINLDKKVKGAKVVAIWGETDEFAQRAVAEGGIPKAVKDPEDMIGEIDAVIVDHRHPKYHLPAAEPFLKARLPLFIDKPFCYRAKEGKAFLARAKRMGVPVCSHSVQPLQTAFLKLKAQVAKAGEIIALTATGPADLDSVYGGIFFYGIHQVESILRLAGFDARSAQVHVFKGGNRHTATIEFASGLLATMNIVKGIKGVNFQYHVDCQGGSFALPPDEDADHYLSGTQRFVKMFKTGVEPDPHEHILMVVRVLEALEKSIASGKREKV